MPVLTRSSLEASPSAAAESSGWKRAQLSPDWISAKRSKKRFRPSVRERFTFVQLKPVLAEISSYE